MVAKNLRFLRKYCFKETQEKLGKELSISQSTISAYEAGDKDVPVDFLKKVSERYAIPLDDLVNKDLSVEFDSPQEFRIDSISKLNERAFPLLTSNLSKTNEAFELALKKVRGYYRLEDEEACYTYVGVMENAITLFRRAWKETNTYVALSNCISTIMMIYALYSQRGKLIEEKLMSKGCVSFRDMQMAYLHDVKTSDNQNPFNKQRQSCFERYEDIVYESIKTLKSNPRFSELGDFYLAMCYLLRFADDAMSYESCNQTGVYMMLQLSKIDNKYADDLLDCLEIS